MTEQEQKFAYSKAAESGFGPGLRDYFEYRDFGYAEASHGLVRAHVLKAVKPCPPEGTGRHAHVLQFQMNYLLKGSMTFEFEGQGEITFHAGDSWMQPPGIKHTLTHYSGDVETIEITMPADFDTRDA